MTQPQVTALHNPYVGLRPYRSEESIYFFGRGEQIKSLLALLHEHHFVAVVGSSGSGKSSLVRAGLIPQLEAGFLVQERDRWHIAIMQPGEAPLRNLMRALLVISGKCLPNEEEEQEEAYLLDQVQERGVHALLDILTPLQENLDTNLLLLVDQFEELFRFALGQQTRRHTEQAESFVALLLRLSEQRRLPVFICLTMRSDFLGDCDAFYGLPEAINRSPFLVPRLTRDQRREAITSPIILAGGRIAPRLSDLLLNENIDTRDDLPILQHLLMRCWMIWQADPQKPAQIDLSHYEQVHTIHHALNDHAQEALQELNARQQVIAKILFQALTTTDAANRRIRRPAHLKEISELTGATPSQVDEVIEAFIREGRSFLVRSAGETADNPLIDISHESLIRQWNQLGSWVDEEAAAAKTYRRLVETAELHTAEKPRYYREADLAQALEWRQGHNATWAKRYPGDFSLANSFLQQSKKVEQQERDQLEQARQERENRIREKAEIAEKKAIFWESFRRVLNLSRHIHRTFETFKHLQLTTLFELSYEIYEHQAQDRHEVVSFLRTWESIREYFNDNIKMKFLERRNVFNEDVEDAFVKMETRIENPRAMGQLNTARGHWDKVRECLDTCIASINGINKLYENYTLTEELETDVVFEHVRDIYNNANNIIMFSDVLNNALLDMLLEEGWEK